MATKQIYIGNLPYETKEEEVRQLCAPFGEVQSVAMIRERDTGRFRGFCFVEMEEKAAKKAIAELDGKEVGGRQIRASEAKRDKKGQGGKKRRGGNDRRPLHERTGLRSGSQDGFPHSGGGRGRRRKDRNDDDRDSEFPFSGGRTRR